MVSGKMSGKLCYITTLWWSLCTCLFTSPTLWWSTCLFIVNMARNSLPSAHKFILFSPVYLCCCCCCCCIQWINNARSFEQSASQSRACFSPIQRPITREISIFSAANRKACCCQWKVGVRLQVNSFFFFFFLWENLCSLSRDEDAYLGTSIWH